LVDNYSDRGGHGDVRDPFSFWVLQHVDDFPGAEAKVSCE
jgi:hypothetical protein